MATKSVMTKSVTPEVIEWLKRSANAGYDTAYDMLSDLIKEKDF